MARGPTISPHTWTATTLLPASTSRVSISPTKSTLPVSTTGLFSYLSVRSSRFFCKCSHQLDIPIDLSRYNEGFARRMAMAGLKPHNRIALGVSGGPDSMALCILAANWKTKGLTGSSGRSQFIDGLLAIVVDHGLRTESKDEAELVSHRVSHLGIRCEIIKCDWFGGQPKLGHLQKAAREMRYQLFQKVCAQHGIGVLFVAHHGDDQAELFILRLSRKSGVLGLAGMAFTCQLFSTYPCCHNGYSSNHGILLVRPLLEFSKDDMYKICEVANQEWVEDPTNASILFARNRIRLSLKNCSGVFKSELQAVISACRNTRSHVDNICRNLINKAVVVMDQGYAVVDLQILDAPKVEDICLSKFVALILQFVSQRNRQVRGSTSNLLLDYIRTFPCKISFTAAGCYLCPFPGSRGTKVLVCCSVDFPLSSKVNFLYETSQFDHIPCILSEIKQIVTSGKSYSDHLVPAASDVPFLCNSPELIPSEALKLNILSETTYRDIILLQQEAFQSFKSKTKIASGRESNHGVDSVNSSLTVPLKPGKLCYFMKRFLITWNMHSKVIGNTHLVDDSNYCSNFEPYHCSSCGVNQMVVDVRPMVEADWLYLAQLAKPQNLESSEDKGTVASPNYCSDYARLSAERALQLLKSIPVAARRSLPVLSSNQGLLLSIPSISFSHCPCLKASAEFKPVIPLGGGYSSFI